MTVTHEQVLDHIELQVATEGVRLDEIDCDVAARLGVDARYYFAYLLVWGAIERYRDQMPSTDEASDRLVPAPEQAQRAREAIDHVGWLASALYQTTAGMGRSGAEVHDTAGRLLAAAVRLRALWSASATEWAARAGGAVPAVPAAGEEACDDR